jgi:hypothetical protein
VSGSSRVPGERSTSLTMGRATVDRAEPAAERCKIPPRNPVCSSSTAARRPRAGLGPWNAYFCALAGDGGFVTAIIFVGLVIIFPGLPGASLATTASTLRSVLVSFVLHDAGYVVDAR